ncbi:hypothetical protein LWF01_02350 [Saxibacter everestensis]|uniref:Uncharacterized protein n=1 Tax=Saxibacter everestensis TaxID=2909229 RepID=A0ABY8QUF4_9MICO|nr:hypothetical protein LWF01_02350 [Brevibacteriaceae bacterium ZFBP1038]
MTRNLPRRLLTALLVLLMTSAGAGSAFAFGSEEDGPVIPEVNNDLQTGEYEGCQVFRSSTTYGLSCGSSVGGDPETNKEILDKDKYPECWYEDPPFDPPAPPEDAKPNGRYVIERCIDNLGDLEKDDGAMPDDIRATLELKYVYDVLHLTDNQKRLVEKLALTKNRIPEPILTVQPSEDPRVGADSLFTLADDDIEAETVQAGGVYIRAVAQVLNVEPVGVGRDQIRCAVNKETMAEFADGDTPLIRNTSCWYRYTSSSAGQEDNEYRAKATAYWQVQVSVDGKKWTNFEDPISKEAIVPITVREVQTQVVP